MYLLICYASQEGGNEAGGHHDKRDDGQVGGALMQAVLHGKGKKSTNQVVNTWR